MKRKFDTEVGCTVGDDLDLEDAWMNLDDETKNNIKIMMTRTFPGFYIDLTTLHPDVNTNPLSIFSNDIIDTIFMNIKESEIRKSKKRLKRQ